MSRHEKIEAAGETILKPVFPFPDRRRFHFPERGGSELAGRFCSATGAEAV